MKELSIKSKNFDKSLENLLSQRRKKLQSNTVSVTNIIKDVKRNGDKALSPFLLTSLIMLVTDTVLDWSFLRL